MAFVQIASYPDAEPDELAEAHRCWNEATEGVAAPFRRLLLADRDQPGHVVELVLYESFEDAMHNAMLPATEAILGRTPSGEARTVRMLHLDVVEGEL